LFGNHLVHELNGRSFGLGLRQKLSQEQDVVRAVFLDDAQEKSGVASAIFHDIRKAFSTLQSQTWNATGHDPLAPIVCAENRTGGQTAA
jgi:hypothetical protein